MYRAGGKLTANFVICQANEANLDIANIPYQYLKQLVGDLGRRSRTSTERGTKPTKLGLPEIDVGATKRCSKLTAEDVGHLKTVQTGGGLGKDDLAKFDNEDNPMCDYCGGQVGTIDHVVFDCTYFQPQRLQHGKQLAKVRLNMLPPSLRRGIAPRLKCDHTKTFWGWTLNDTTAEVQQLLGIEHTETNHDYITEATREEVMLISSNYKLNARQAIELHKGPFGEGITPCFPCDVESTPPTNIYTYIEVSASPLRAGSRWQGLASGHQTPTPLMTLRGPVSAATGGPLVASNSPELPADQGTGDVYYTATEQTDEGKLQWSLMPGQRCSSTRVEIVAAAISLVKNAALHIGTDSAAMLAKASKLQTAAAEWTRSVQQH